MHLTISAQSLAGAADKAAAFTGKGYSAPVWLRAENGLLTLFSTNGSLEFFAERAAMVTQPGHYGVPGQTFAALVKSLGDGEITLSAEQADCSIPDAPDSLHIIQGRRKLRLPCTPIAWKPDSSLPEPEGRETVWNGRELADAISATLYCAASTDSGDALHCIHFKKGRSGTLDIVALDGYSCAVFEHPSPAVAEGIATHPLNLAGNHIRALVRWLPKTDIALTREDNRLTVRSMEDGEYLSLPLNKTPYPDCTNFLAKKHGPHGVAVFDRAELASVVSRALLLTPESDKTKTVVPHAILRLSGTEASFSLDSEHGTLNETLTLHKHYDGPCASLGFPIKNIGQALGHFPSDQISVTITGAETPIFVTSEAKPGYTLIVMPIKIVRDLQYYDSEDKK